MDNVQDKQMSFFRFEDLRIYAKANDYSEWLIRNLAEPSDKKQLNLVNSFCHSSFDIALNIAEGSSRNKSQFEHCLKISKTAIRECIVYTTLAFRIGLLDGEQCEASRQTLMELTRMVGALIISLQRGSNRRHSEYESASNDEVEMFSSVDDNMLDSIDTNF